MKKVLSIYFIILILCSLPASASPMPYIDFGVKGGIVGDSIMVPITITQNDILGGSFNIQYDAEVLQPITVEKKAGLGNAVFNFNINSQPNKIRLNWLRSDIGSEGVPGGVICEAVFRIKSNAKTQTELTIDAPLFYNNALQQVYCNIGKGIVYINTLYAATVFEQNGSSILRNLQTGSLTVGTSIYNSSGANKHVSVCIATYTADNKLYESIVNEYESFNGVTKSANKTLIIGSDIAKVKVFYWNGLDSLNPYVKTWEIQK